MNIHNMNLSREELIQQFKDEIDYSELLKNGLNSRFDLLLTLLKLEMPGPENQKIDKLNKRISKFFDYGGYSIDISKDHFFSRREPDYSSPNTHSLKNQLVLFGVDFMSTRKIKCLFAGLDPKIAWIDSSHCKLIFSTHSEAVSGLNKILHPDKESQITESKEIPKKWFECRPYREITFERILQCRFATSLELIVESMASPNYEAYRRAKKSFENNLLSHFRGSLKKYQELFSDKSGRHFQTISLENQDRYRSREKIGRFNAEGRRDTYRARSQGRKSSVPSSRRVEKLEHSKKGIDAIPDYDSESFSFILGPERSEVSEISQGSMLNRMNNLNLDMDMSFTERAEKYEKGEELSFIEVSESERRSFDYSQYVKEQEEKEEQEKKKSKQRRLAMRKNKQSTPQSQAAVIEID